MKANELRIGNIVNASDCINLEVLGISSSNVGLKLEHTKFISANIDELKPIPLTEEWLLKFGFKEYIDFGCKTKQFDLLPLQGFSYNLNTKKVRIMHKGNSQSHCLKNEVEFIHQLQNLYFALTGEELKIK